MTVAGSSRVYSENIAQLAQVVNTPGTFSPTLLTSLGVNESDLESDLPLPWGVKLERDGERKNIARVLTLPINAAIEISQHHLTWIENRKKSVLLLSPSFVI